MPLSRPRLALLALLAVPAACISDPVTGKHKGSVLSLSPEQERELGRELAPDIEAKLEGVVPDARADEVLGGIVAGMVALSPRKDELEFEFKILNSSVPNAMALPGGRVYITRGLLQDIHTEAEFVSVMGHEFGHVDHRHASRVPWSTAILSVPAIPFELLHRWLPVGRRVTGAATTVVASPATLTNLGFSRSQELEADRRGLFFAAQLGYDPRDFRQVFELFDRLEAESGGEGPSKHTLLRTHPKSKDRIEQIDKILARDYPDLDGREFRGTSPEVESILEGFRARSNGFALYDQAVIELGDGTDEEGIERSRQLIDGALNSVPDEPLFWILRGEQEVYGGNEVAARRAFERAHAVYERGSPGDGHWKPPFYLGMYAVHDGDWQTGLPLLETASARYPSYGFIYYVKGQAHELAGKRDEAAEAYRQALKRELDDEVAKAARARLEVIG